MKKLVRAAATLSSAFFFLSGAILLAKSGFRLDGDYIIPTALGLFLLGIAFFTGPFLWLLAEKWFPKSGGR